MYLALLGGNGCVAVDELCEDSTKRLDSKRQRCDVEQKNVGDVTSEYATLDGCTDGHGFIGVDRLAWLTTEDIQHCCLNLQDNSYYVYALRMVS